MENLKPLHDYILAVRPVEEETTKFGIVIKSKEEEPDTATVLSVGPGRTLSNGTIEEMRVLPGDEIVFTTYTRKAEEDGKLYIWLKQEHIIAYNRK